MTNNLAIISNVKVPTMLIKSWYQ